jgi:hypothetical protein
MSLGSGCIPIQRTAAVILCLLVSFSVRAAEFSKSNSSDGGPDVIFVIGDLTLGDDRQFANFALSSTDAVVVFQSPGGNLRAGIEIGRAIHLKGFATLVPDTVQCASACALAWLGGRIRYMSNTAQVGFHAVESEGQATVSSSGNALVGAYLNQLGLPASAIIYITDASPQGMQWLNFTDAQRFGIDVRPFDLSDQPVAVHGNSSNDSLSAPISSVKKEVHEFVNATNLSSEVSLSYLEGKYQEQVNYYGRLIPKASVLNDKNAFFKKWPVRKYFIEPSSVSVTCKTTSECKAEGVVDWEASGPILNSKGSATLALLWTLEGKT